MTSGSMFILLTLVHLPSTRINLMTKHYHCGKTLTITILLYCLLLYRIPFHKFVYNFSGFWIHCLTSMGECFRTTTGLYYWIVTHWLQVLASVLTSEISPNISHVLYSTRTGILAFTSSLASTSLYNSSLS